MPPAGVAGMHTCPMVTVLVPRAGGPIIPPGAITVLTGGLPTARIGDRTEHGGVIVRDERTVMIGEGGAGTPSVSPAAGGGLNIGPAITIQGGLAFQTAADIAYPVRNAAGTGAVTKIRWIVGVFSANADLQAREEAVEGTPLWRMLKGPPLRHREERAFDGGLPAPIPVASPGR